MSGAQDYLPKDDLNSTQLLRSLQYAIERKKREEELTALNRINALIRDINKALLTATTRAEIEQAACERFVATDPYKFAIVGEFSSDFEQFTERHWESVDNHDLEDVMESEGQLLGQQPAAEAIETHEVQVIENITEELLSESEEEETAEPKFESVAAIPLVFEMSVAAIPLEFGTVHGVLVVYTDRSHAFDEQEREVLGELGQTIGYAMTALKGQIGGAEPRADSPRDSVDDTREEESDNFHPGFY
ncbi:MULTISPECIES: GAF domain-containing protein [Haloferax]|nr:GAF domain-containing protein [Haloferax mediterranei]MDX5990114.1 GAF domain-containing protein [Haloferax mediterranei ATCC 33500]